MIAVMWTASMKVLPWVIRKTYMSKLRSRMAKLLRWIKLEMGKLMMVAIMNGVDLKMLLRQSLINKIRKALLPS